MKRCPTCGLKLDDSQTFCTNDGTPLVADKSSYDPQATLVGSPRSSPTQASGGGPQGGAPTGWQTPARPTAQPVYGQYGQPAGPRPSKFVPGLVGGVVTAILCLFANFLPVTGFITASFLCIVWAIIGGAVAGRLFVKRSPVPVRTGEGALVGMVAGGFGALLYLVLDTLVAYAILAEDIERLYRAQGQPQVTGGAFFAVSGLFGAVFIFGLSIVGGIIGVAMFEKRQPYHTSVPPPPPGFGFPPGGYR